MIRSLWASITQNPKAMVTINGWATLLWIAMVPISMWFGWLSSVQYVSALSLWALVSGHLSAWQAARVEVKQDEQENKLMLWTILVVLAIIALLAFIFGRR